MSIFVFFRFVFVRKLNFVFVGIFVYGRKRNMLFGRPLVAYTSQKGLGVGLSLEMQSLGLGLEHQAWS